MSILLSLQPRDPIVARDGRPFGEFAGNRMRSLPWPLPSTVAGAIRTLLGYAAGGNFADKLVRRLKQVACHGPLPVSGGRLFLPAPSDAIVGLAGACVTLRPEEMRDVSDLPGGLLPVLPPPSVALMKFGAPPAWWSRERMTRWLISAGDAAADFFQPPSEFRNSPLLDERTHVRIDAATFAAKTHLLFSSAGLVLDDLVEPGQSPPSERSHATQLAVRVDPFGDSTFQQQLATLDELRPLGGERRLLRVQPADAAARAEFDCPPEVQNALSQVRVGDGLRMVLVTPAIFEHGWRPGWLNQDAGRVGTPPGIAPSKLKLRLTAVCNQRWEAVSGWSYEAPCGSKAVKRLTPAGSVLFFRVEAIDPGAAVQLWLQPTSDAPQDQLDGFGLAVWGLWDQR